MKGIQRILVVVIIGALLAMPALGSNGTLAATGEQTITEAAPRIPEKEWDKTFGGSSYDYGHSVAETSDGGYIITGSTQSYGAGLKDVWLIKTDGDGNKEWDKTFGGSHFDCGQSVAETSDGGYIIAGYTSSYGAGFADVWLIKTDADGNKEWDKTFGGSHQDHGWSVAETSDGGYIIAGITFSNTGYPLGDAWLIKTDGDGNKEWDKTFGGSADDYGWSVAETSDGGYVIAGRTSSYGAGYSDAWLIKTDGDGNKQWDKTFGGSGRDYGQSVAKTSDGGYIIAGFTKSYGAGGRDAWLIKTDGDGNKEWDKTFGGLGTDCGYSAVEASDGGYIIAGYTYSYGAGSGDAWLIKTDADGNKEWDKTFGGSHSDIGDSVAETSDGGYIIAGTTSSYGAGFEDVWLIKVSVSDTTAPWVTSTSPEADATDVAVDTMITATFSGAMDASTITAGSFTVVTDSTPLSGGVSYDSGTYTATFTPSANLSYGTTYSATLSTAITNVAGSPLAADYSWSFTTIAAAAVSINAPNEVAPGSDFTANVNISGVTNGVTNFDAASYDVSFDASVLRLDDVTSGLIGSTTIPVDMYNEISPGTYHIIQDVPGLAGVSGSGYLAVLHFHVIGSAGDSSTISLSNGMLENNQAEEITAAWVGDTVDVVTPVPVSIDAPDVVAPDSDFQANVNISEVVDLDYCYYEVSFDTSVLRLDDVISGLIGSTTMEVTIYNEISSGTWRIVQNLPGLAGVSGSGYLAVLHFHVIGSQGDSSNIDVHNGVLLDTSAEEIPSTWVGDSVDVTSVLPGDANGDGNVNALDITKVKRIVAGLDAETPGADANQDGNINALDITKVKRIIVGLD